MVGVDLTDRMLSYCPSKGRTVTWTLRVLLHFFDLTLTNSWLQMRATKISMGIPSKDIAQFRTFKLQYGQSLIERNNKSAQDRQGQVEEDEEEEQGAVFPDRRMTRDLSMERRTQGAAYLPEATKGIQKRCAMKKCKKKSTVYCIKCNVYLCLVDG